MSLTEQTQLCCAPQKDIARCSSGHIHCVYCCCLALQLPRVQCFTYNSACHFQSNQYVLLFLQTYESLPPHEFWLPFLSKPASMNGPRNDQPAAAPLHPWFAVDYQTLRVFEWRQAQNAIRHQRPDDYSLVTDWLWEAVSELDDRTIWMLCYRVYEGTDDVACRLLRRIHRFQSRNHTRNGFDFVSDDSDDDTRQMVQEPWHMEGEDDLPLPDFMTQSASPVPESAATTTAADDWDRWWWPDC